MKGNQLITNSIRQRFNNSFEYFNTIPTHFRCIRLSIMNYTHKLPKPILHRNHHSQLPLRRRNLPPFWPVARISRPNNRFQPTSSSSQTLQYPRQPTLRRPKPHISPPITNNIHYLHNRRLQLPISKHKFSGQPIKRNI